MHFTFVINPAAGKGRGARLRGYIERTISRWEKPVRILSPKDRDETRRLVRDLAGESDSCFVAVGGDGTVSQVAAGIIEAGTHCHLGVIPTGSGNDFWRMTGLPARVPKALDELKCARPAACDYGRISWTEEGGHCEAVFLNATGVGFDAAAADAAGRMPLPGILGYIAAAVLQLARWNAPEVDVMPQGYLKPIRQRLLFAYAGNGIFGGGGFRLLPEASIQDGYLDVCVVKDVPFFRGLVLLPRALYGTHVSAPEVNIMRVKALDIHSESPLPLHVDGELLSRTATSIRIQIVAGGISVLLPAVKKI